MTQTLRIGIVGCGGIVRDRHLPNLRKMPGVDVVSLCNRSEASSQKAADELGISHIHKTWQELVHSDDIDIIWIGTWPSMHCPITLEALKANKHVFCQARMAMSLEEAHKMQAVAQSSSKLTMLCPPPFGLKGDPAMRQLMDDGFLGDIYTIHFRSMQGNLVNPNAPITWRQRQDLSGVNTLTVGIYAEVIHRWFGYAKSVTAQAKTFIPERPTSDNEMMNVDRPDSVLAITEMENGALMRWEWSGLASPVPASTVEAFGSKGALRYNFDDDTIMISSNGEKWQSLEMRPERTQEWSVEQEFIDAILHGDDVHPNFEDGVKYMELTEAIFQSAKTQKQIDLPL